MEPKLLWQPDELTRLNSNMYHYMQWLEVEYGLVKKDYQELWEWSVEHTEEFWASLWKYFDIRSHDPYQEVTSQDPMPYTRWFEGATLNYAEHVFRNSTEDFPALVFKSESSSIEEISWKELEQKVASFRSYLISIGIRKGDRVVAYIPNIPEATIAFLAANSIGAIWSSCSPDFGTGSVIDRFAQIEPKVLVAVDGYRYGGKSFDKMEVLSDLQKSLPTLEKTVIIPYLNSDPDRTGISDTILWQETLTDTDTALEFDPVPFSHPIWVLYSSGTTGLPKPITHCHGGVLLEMLKYLTFHADFKTGERCFWYTTTGWMMWNYIQGSLLLGGTVVLYDGSPAYPDMNVLWEFSQDARIHHFGTSAGYVVANMKAGTHPGKDFDLSIRSIGSTGSPLPPEGFDWLYDEVSEDLWLTSLSGGTDVCSAFVGGNPLWPVYSGEIQCRALGCALEAFDENGNALTDEVGEMVITKPMPSMPVYFWNDKEHKRYLSSYFEMYPGIWRHGDWIQITPRNGLVIYGRSDSTLNRGGVRIGTAEIYRAMDKIPEVADSLIICIEKEDGDFYMPLYVMLAEGLELNEDLDKMIRTRIREEYSPRHVPDEIVQVPEIPYTISGKKVETPVKKILLGQDPGSTINRDALKNPDSLNTFIEIAAKKTF